MHFFYLSDSLINKHVKFIASEDEDLSVIDGGAGHAPSPSQLCVPGTNGGGPFKVLLSYEPPLGPAV